MAFATLDAGVEVVSLSTLQPAEVAARGGEVVEPGEHPAERLVYVVALRNHRHLRGVGTEHGGLVGDGTGERIAVEDAHMAPVGDVAGQNLLQRRADERIHITGLLHSAAGHGDTAHEVHPPGVEQAAEEDDGRGIDRPHHLALVDRRDVVDLHADIACRTRTVEDIHLHILRPGQGFRRLPRTDAEADPGDPGQCRQSRLEVVLLPFQLILEVALQGLVTKRRHEDGLRRRVGTRGDGIRQLGDIPEQPRLQQCVLDLVCRQARHVLHAEVSILLLRIGSHLHTQHLTPFSALDRRDGAAHGGGEAHLRAALVHEQRIAGTDVVAFTDGHPGGHAHEVVGHERILHGCLHGQQLFLRTSCKVNV